MFVIANPQDVPDSGDFLLGKPQAVHITTEGGRGVITIDGTPIPGVIAEGVVLKPGDAKSITTLTVTFMVGEVRIDDDIADLTDIRLPMGSDSRVYLVDDDDTRPFRVEDLDALEAVDG